MHPTDTHPPFQQNIFSNTAPSTEWSNYFNTNAQPYSAFSEQKSLNLEGMQDSQQNGPLSAFSHHHAPQQQADATPNWNQSPGMQQHQNPLFSQHQQAPFMGFQNMWDSRGANGQQQQRFGTNGNASLDVSGSRVLTSRFGEDANGTANSGVQSKLAGIWNMHDGDISGSAASHTTNGTSRFGTNSLGSQESSPSTATKPASTDTPNSTSSPFASPHWSGMGFHYNNGPFSQAPPHQQHQYPSFHAPQNSNSFMNGSPYGSGFGAPHHFGAPMGGPHGHFMQPPFMAPFGGAPSPGGPPPENALDVSDLEKEFQSLAVKTTPAPLSKAHSITIADQPSPQSHLALQQQKFQQTPPVAVTSTPVQSSSSVPANTTQQAAKNTSAPSASTPVTKKRVQKLRFGRGRPRIDDRFLHEPQSKFLPSKKVTKMITKLYNELKPDDSEVDKKQVFITSMQNIIQRKWPHAEVHVFGSSRSGLSLKGNADVDLCMVIDYKAELKQRISANEERFLRRQIEKLQRKEQREMKKRERLEASREYLVDYATAEDMDEISPVVEEEDLILNEEDSLEPHMDEYYVEDHSYTSRSRDIDPQAALDKKRAKILANSLKQMQKEYINQLTQLLRHRRMNNVMGIFTSRVPIVKFEGGDSPNYQCDICVNNVLGIVNSDFLKAYCDIDARVRPLAYSIKFWSKKRAINDARNGSLSSYGYVLMLLHYLQNVSPPVLPVLHDLSQFKSGTKIKQNIVVFQDDEYDCTYFNRVDLIKHKSQPEWKSQNEETTGSLLAGFFRFYGWEFDFERHVVSVRTRATVTKQEKAWTADKKERSEVCIEDPFEREFNVGRCVWKQKRDVIINECIRAYYMLNDGLDFKNMVCAPISE